jgi:hypothetical protein
MPRTSRLLVAIASLLLVVTFFVPLWRVELHAPQYPEGIGMLIRLHTVTGIKPQDLNNINGLNHYIGMKPIVPDAIPDLKFMPWIVGALIAGGLLVALLGRRRGLYAWTGTFAALLLAGLVDFWRWEYMYGHDLAPDAIISVPGMSYQPPLIGTKQLLNFVASSWPDVGAVVLGISFALGFAAIVLMIRDARVPGGMVATPAGEVAPVVAR